MSRPYSQCVLLVFLARFRPTLTSPSALKNWLIGIISIRTMTINTLPFKWWQLTSIKWMSGHVNWPYSTLETYTFCQNNVPRDRHRATCRSSPKPVQPKLGTEKTTRIDSGCFIARHSALRLLAPLCWGSNSMKGSCQLLTEGCWFTPRNNLYPPAVETDRHI